ncbi:MAG: hypothetical protein AAFP19_08495 [Bacteroidota bacterium]
MKNPYHLLLWLSWPLLLLACSQKENLEPTPLYTNLSDLDAPVDWSKLEFDCNEELTLTGNYLHGYINDQEFCYQHNEENYTSFQFLSPHYAQDNPNEPTIIGRRLRMSLQEFPDQSNKAYFEFQFPVILDPDAEKGAFFESLMVGDYLLDEADKVEENFIISLVQPVTIGLDNQNTATTDSIRVIKRLGTELGTQQEGALTLISFEKNEFDTFDKYRVEYAINCLLYESEGQAALFEIKDMIWGMEIIVPK